MDLSTLNIALEGLSQEIILGIVALAIWSLIWKGIALWKCGRNDQLNWFVVLLILNTAGILPIVYLLWFQRKK